APYGWLGDMVLPSAMPAHVIYPQVDPHPARFSPYWITTLLRDNLVYDGVVFCDDLPMERATVAGDMLGRAQAALGAGCGTVLACTRPDLADVFLARSQHQPSRESQRRSRSPMPRDAAPDWPTLQSLARYQYARQLQSQI